MTSSTPKARKSSTKSKAKRGSKAKKAAEMKVVPRLSKTPPPFRNKVVDKKVVIDYVNSLHPAQQMFVINYKYNLTTENSLENSETMELN